MLTLPPQGHPARDLFDVADLVAMATGVEPLAVLPAAISSAKRFLAANPAARRVACIVLRGEDDQVDLITVGPRGGWRKEWRFGPVPRTARVV